MGQLPSGLHGADAVSVGDWIDCGSVEVTTARIDAFAELTGDRFEIHMSTKAAQRHGFTERVAHGLLVLSMIDGLKNQAPAQLKARASMGWDWTFRHPVLAGDDLSAVIQIAGVEPAKTATQAVLLLDVEVSNQRGEVVQSGRNRLLAYRT